MLDHGKGFTSSEGLQVPSLLLLGELLALGILEHLTVLMVAPSGLIPLFVINFLNPLFLGVGPVDSLGVVIGNSCRFARTSNAIILVVYEAHKFAALLVGDLYVLSDHVLPQSKK